MATDVASKGLDFPDIQHVINYDMPDEIENYVHRIGRTGRCGKTGIATTFINKNQSESILLDLKHLLQEAKQRIPPVLTVSLALSSSSLHYSSTGKVTSAYETPTPEPDVACMYANLASCVHGAVICSARTI